MARRPLIGRGSILAPKEEAPPPPAPDDMTERVIQRNRERNRRDAPAPEEGKTESESEASAYVNMHIDKYADMGISDSADMSISAYAPANVPIFSTVEELERCSLPTSPDAARAFLEAASGEALGRAPIYLKAPMGLDVLLVRLLGGYRAKKYKQDFIIRGIKLVLYELYTGRTLVEFGDGTDPKPEKRGDAE